MFSPYYFAARRKGAHDPANFSSINVCLYGRDARRWTMTERSSRALEREQNHFRIGPSSLSWEGDTLTIRIDEIANPFPRRVRGVVRLHAGALMRQAFQLDAAGAHLWKPIAPVARVEVALTSPGLGWSGAGYFDSNFGARALEQDFVSWHWSRAATQDGAHILYDVLRRDGERTGLWLDIDAEGRAATFTPPPVAPLPSTFWRIARATRAEPGTTPQVVETLEDTPFYARSLVRTRVHGFDGVWFHESLDLDRFRSRIVQGMLPFRMPRRA